MAAAAAIVSMPVTVAMCVCLYYCRSFEKSTRLTTHSVSRSHSIIWLLRISWQCSMLRCAVLRFQLLLFCSFHMPHNGCRLTDRKYANSSNQMGDKILGAHSNIEFISLDAFAIGENWELSIQSQFDLNIFISTVEWYFCNAHVLLNLNIASFSFLFDYYFYFMNWIHVVVSLL